MKRIVMTVLTLCLLVPEQRNQVMSQDCDVAVCDDAGACDVAGCESLGCTSCAGRETLLRDCRGLRSRLQEHGISFLGRVTQYGMGVAGGVNDPSLPSRLQGDTFQYTGNAQYDFIFDLERIFGCQAGQLIVTAEQAPWGRFASISPNTGAISSSVFNSLFAFAPDDPGVPYLTRFLYIQPLSEQFIAVVGKSRIVEDHDDDIFAGGDGVIQFMNLAFVDNPALLLSTPASSFFASAIMPREWGAMEIFAIDPQDRTTEAFSRLGELFSQGIILGGEILMNTNLCCKPGKYRVGGIWKHADRPDLRFTVDPPAYPNLPTRADVATRDDGYTLYFNFDQYVGVYSDEPRRGWGLFGRASISDGNPTPLRSFFSVGIGGFSPSRNRPDDRFGIGWYYFDASDAFGPIPQALFGPRDGNGLEAFYNFQVTPWLNVTPDVQFIHPGASRLTRGDDAFVYGLRVNMTL